MAWFVRKKPAKAHRPAHVPDRILDGLNIVVGAGQTSYPGWQATNLDVLDITSSDDWSRYTNGRPVDRVLAEHVFEHLTAEQTARAFANIAAHLAPGGHVRIAVPDGFHPDPDYIAYVRPGGVGAGAHDHKVLLDHVALADQLVAAGLQPRPLEWFDQSGCFRAMPWDQSEGPVLRSAGSDARNIARPFSYTSLIMDGVKGHE